MARTQGVKESLWLQAILKDLGARKHMEEMRNINVDNQGALALAHNPQFHARTKHIDIQYHFIREHMDNKSITLIYCPTGDMTADIFTKALPEPAFVKHNLGLGLIDYAAFALQGTASPSTPEFPDSDHGQSTPKYSPGEGWYCESPEHTCPPSVE